MNKENREGHAFFEHVLFVAQGRTKCFPALPGVPRADGRGRLRLLDRSMDTSKIAAFLVDYFFISVKIYL